MRKIQYQIAMPDTPVQPWASLKYGVTTLACFAPAGWLRCIATEFPALPKRFFACWGADWL